MATHEGCLDQREAARELGVGVFRVTAALLFSERLQRCPQGLHDHPRREYITAESLLEFKAWRAATGWRRRTAAGVKTLLKVIIDGL